MSAALFHPVLLLLLLLLLLLAAAHIVASNMPRKHQPSEAS